MKVYLGDFNLKEERENIFKPTIGNKNLHQINNNNNNNNNNNVVRIVNFQHKKSSLKITIFPE